MKYKCPKCKSTDVKKTDQTFNSVCDPIDYFKCESCKSKFYIVYSDILCNTIKETKVV